MLQKALQNEKNIKIATNQSQKKEELNPLEILSKSSCKLLFFMGTDDLIQKYFFQFLFPCLQI